MTINLPHVRDRDGVYQYERRVPLRIQRNRSLFEQRFHSRPLFRQSLRSKDLASATLAYGAIHQRFEALIAPLVAKPALVETDRQVSRTLTDHDIAAIAARYERLTAAPFEKLHRRAAVDAAAAAELERLEHDLAIDAEAIGAALRSRDVDADAPIIQPIAEAAALIDEHGLFAPEGSDERGAVVGAVRIGLERGYRRITALSQGEVLPKLDGSPAALKPINSLTLADAVGRYIEARKPPVKAVTETRLALRQFEQVVGRKTLAAVTRDDVHRFVEFLSNQKVGGKTAGSIARHLSPESVRKRLRLLSATVNHARDRGLFDGHNLFAGIKVAAYAKESDKAIMPTKRRLQISELNAIFSHPWFTGCASPNDIYTPGNHRLSGAEYWVPIVALFTGCRAGELGGLKVNEVRLDDPHPHIVVRNNEHRRTKNKRMRCVPILDALIELGFPAYFERIKAAGHDRLFPDWVARKRKGATEGDYPAWSNSGVVRAFNRQVIPAMLKDRLPPDARREVTFHSLRGTFKAMLVAGNNVSITIANEIVGHAQAELDQRYIGEVTIEETYPAVKACRFNSLLLNKLASVSGR